MDAPTLTDNELNEIYTWVDSIPLTRPKRHIARDFADGVLVAEVVHHFLPKLVDLHNYAAANSHQSKLYNWSTLNTKVFKRMGFQITQKDVDAVISTQVGAIERVLKVLQVKLLLYNDNDQNTDIQKSPNNNNSQIHNNNNSLIHEKDLQIQEQKETIEILDIKINKLEQLVKLKNARIEALTEKLHQLGYKF